MRARDFIDEYKVDNKSGLGSVPYNQDVDYFGMKVMMKPSTFLKLALPLNKPISVDHIAQHIKNGGSLGAPFLDVSIPPKWEEGDMSEPARVSGHEGRNRMLAIQQVEGDDSLCILLNVCDCSMADGDFSKSEMILFSRMLSSLGYDKNSFKPYFDTISLKHKHSVFGANTDTAGGEMTPVRALVVSMLYMMSVDGEMAKEEIGQINVALRGSKNLLPEALKYVKRTKFPDFMSAVSPDARETHDPRCTHHAVGWAC